MNAKIPAKEKKDEGVVEAHLVIFGRVQGVGFRVRAQKLALGKNLYGTVGNLSDGTVEIRIQGTKPELEAFFKALQELFHGYIDHFNIDYVKPEYRFESFIIVR